MLPITAIFTATFSACILESAAASDGKADPSHTFQISEETQILLENHCLDCHDDIEHKGDIRLDNLAELELPKRLDILNRVQEQVYFQHMPPKKKKGTIFPIL
jgi:hypothetical protein